MNTSAHEANPPLRHGDRWTAEDNDDFIAQVSAGHDSTTIAAAMGRSVVAIRARAKGLLPDGHVISQQGAVADLRQLIADDPDRDWPPLLSRGPKQTRFAWPQPTRQWSQSEQSTLADAWRTGVDDLPTLAETFATTQEGVVAQLHAQHLCVSPAHAFARLRATDPPEAAAIARAVLDADVEVPAFRLDRRTENGTGWDESHYRELVTLMRAGLDPEAVALCTGRTAGAIRARAKWLIPVDSASDAGRYAAVQDALRDPSYPWMDYVRDQHRARDSQFWSDAATEAVKKAWEAGNTALGDLAADCDLTEEAIARRLVRHGFADDLAAVVRRLPATPGSVADQHALDSQSQGDLYVLVVGPMAGDPQVSAHPTRADAESQRDATTEGIDLEWLISEVQIGAEGHRSVTVARSGEATPGQATTPTSDA